jgi:hypothetical protein
MPESVKLAVTNPPKALIALVAMICIVVLMVTESIGADAGTGMLGSIVGYAIGNGIAAKTHHKVDPIIGAR